MTDSIVIHDCYQPSRDNLRYFLLNKNPTCTLSGDVLSHAVSSFDGLGSALAQARDARPGVPVTSLVLDCYSDFLPGVSVEDWTLACQQIAQSLPDVNRLDTRFMHSIKDAYWAILIKQLSPHLQSLVLEDFQHDMPKAFEAIGHCQQLKNALLTSREAINIDANEGHGGEGVGFRGLSPNTCTVLAKSFQKLPFLRRVDLNHFTFQNKEKCVPQLFEFLRRRGKLEKVNFTQYWVHNDWVVNNASNDDSDNNNMIDESNNNNRETMNRTSRENDAENDTNDDDEQPEIQFSRLRRHVFTPTEQQQLQYGPRLNQIKKDFLASDKPTTEDMVRAIISTKDHLDCFHYFLRQLDPMTTYAANFSAEDDDSSSNNNKNGDSVMDDVA